jgi:hypothetical protein
MKIRSLMLVILVLVVSFSSCMQEVITIKPMTESSSQYTWECIATLPVGTIISFEGYAFYGGDMRTKNTTYFFYTMNPESEMHHPNLNYRVLAKDIPPAIGSYIQVKAEIQPPDYLTKAPSKKENMIVELDRKEIKPSPNSSNDNPLQVVKNQVLKFTIRTLPPEIGTPFQTETFTGTRKWYIGRYQNTDLTIITDKDLPPFNTVLTVTVYVQTLREYESSLQGYCFYEFERSTD